MAGLVAAVTPAPLVLVLVLVGRGGRLRQAAAAAVTVLVTLGVSAELFRRLSVRLPSAGGGSTSLLLGIAFIVVAGVVFAVARLGRRRRELPWVDLLDAAGPARVALITALLVACNIKNQALVAIAVQDASWSAPLLYALIGVSGPFALLVAGALLRDRRHHLHTVHDWLERRQTQLAVITFAVVGGVLLMTGLAR
ncbi:MAG: hypothetical protein JWN72_516 [Thermoleophilia bacterium]|nr:hypothetical protein [Thermoleophilia bacterium]